ncbi:hypothetical protein [Actinocatenispora rupis]|uniref:Uncharacterized protein n=1 Tax=Actinocatenispora rupis TaxID=519421 RepID=A0A8J3J089_9ACTN|nr:hypothetical protein [Actinocatenispora rupis]GID11828.1 hypothetical protein Aru02nite_27170 [Actinocatenispora rupis]
MPNWEAVSVAMTDRMAELDLTQADVAHKAGVALMTVRELQRNLRPRRRNPRTLAAVSEALSWPRSRLEDLANGARGEGADARSGRNLAQELDALRQDLRDLSARVDEIETGKGKSR